MRGEGEGGGERGGSLTEQWRQSTSSGEVARPVGYGSERVSLATHRWRGSRSEGRGASWTPGSPPDTSGSAPEGSYWS